MTQCNLWVGVLGWIRDLEWCPIKAVLGGSSLGEKKFSWSNSNFTQFDSTFSKDEFLNSWLELLWLIQVSAFGKKKNC